MSTMMWIKGGGSGERLGQGCVSYKTTTAYVLSLTRARSLHHRQVLDVATYPLLTPILTCQPCDQCDVNSNRVITICTWEGHTITLVLPTTGCIRMIRNYCPQLSKRLSN